MLDVLRNPSFWASVGVILAALGVVDIEAKLWQHIAELIAILGGIIGIIFAVRDERSDAGS